MAFKVGDVIFFDNYGSFYGNLITTYQQWKYGRSDATHVGIISKVLKNRIIVHEACAEGFVENFYEKDFINRGISNDKIYIKQSKKRLTNVQRYCDKYLGRGYSWFDIVRIGVTYVLGFHLAFGCSRHLICSEAVSRILYDASNKKLNLSKEYGKPYDLITPQEVFSSKFLE